MPLLTSTSRSVSPNSKRILRSVPAIPGDDLGRITPSLRKNPPAIPTLLSHAVYRATAAHRSHKQPIPFHPVKFATLSPPSPVSSLQTSAAPKHRTLFHSLHSKSFSWIL